MHYLEEDFFHFNINYIEENLIDDQIKDFMTNHNIYEDYMYLSQKEIFDEWAT